MQVPCGVHSAGPQESPVRDDPARIEGSVSSVGETERVCDRGGLFAARPRAHAHLHSPKHSAASILGFLKGKSSIWIAQNIASKQRNLVGHKFWARGYFVSTVGTDEQIMKTYMQNQEKEDKRMDDLFNRQEVTLTASSGS